MRRVRSMGVPWPNAPETLDPLGTPLLARRCTSCQGVEIATTEEPGRCPVCKIATETIRLIGLPASEPPTYLGTSTIRQSAARRFGSPQLGFLAQEPESESVGGCEIAALPEAGVL